MEMITSGSSASSPSFARHTAEIPEIRDTICEFASSHKKHACATLTSLLRVSHAFFFSAARVLWGTQKIKTEDLLPLLPGVTKEYPNPIVLTIRSNIPDPLPEHYFDRFGLYAPYVKHLEFRLDEYIHTGPQGLSAIRSSAQTHVLLPNIISLVAQNLDPYIDRDLTTETLDWLDVLISPSLQRLDLVDVDNILPDGTLGSLYGLIITILDRCPSLADLSFCYNGITTTGPELPAPIAALHATIPTNLVNLQCRFAPLCPEPFAWLANMTKLQRVEFIWPWVLDRAHPGSFSSEHALFPELRCLALKQCPLEETQYILQTSLVDNLTCLEIHFSPENGWNHPDVVELFKQLAKSCSKLTELSLNHFSTTTLFQSLLLLQDLPLRKVFIPDYARRLFGEPLTVRGLFEHWSSLSELDLCAYEASFEDLQDILPFVPGLSVLRLHIKLNIPEEIPDAELKQALALQSRVAYRPLKLISSHDTPQVLCELLELDEVARYLLSLRPHISYWISSDTQKPWRYQHHKWLEYLNAQLQAPPNTQRGRQNKWEGFEGLLE